MKNKWEFKMHIVQGNLEAIEKTDIEADLEAGWEPMSPCYVPDLGLIFPLRRNQFLNNPHWYAADGTELPFKDVVSEVPPVLWDKFKSFIGRDK